MTASSQSSSDHEHHGPALSTYFGVFAALMVLTGVTVAVAYANLGAMAAPAAVVIAAVKATLVILFFMHVKYETRLIGLYALSGFLLVAILIVITMGEIAGRAPSKGDPLGPAAPAPSASARPR